MQSPVLSLPPSPAFWLDELGFARFPHFLPLLEAPPALASALQAELTSSSVREEVTWLVDGETDPASARLHLLLVAAFLEKKKSSAVRDVARAFLDPDELARHGGDSEHQVARLPLAIELYLCEPRHLLAIEVCHRWHSGRRCAMEASGPRRSIPAPLGELPWGEIGAAAVSAIPTALRSRHRPGWSLAIPRAGGAEVLVAFRERAYPAAVRDEGGKVRAGHRDGWTILRFHKEARRVDLTGRSHQLAHALAEAVASEIWGTPVSYVPAAGKLTGVALQEFLCRLRDPEDDTFRLLEITAELPTHEDRPVLCLGNAGQTRVEPSLQTLRRSQVLAERWETVHRVKVGFGQRHRVVVHF